jgi:hypothetical protein
MPRVARCGAAIKRTKPREQLFPNTPETHLVLFQQRSVTMELSPPYYLCPFYPIGCGPDVAEGRARKDALCYSQ